MNELTEVRQIVPELIRATKAGRLQWSGEAGKSSFTTEIGGHKLEIERGEYTSGPGIYLWLWADSSHLIDSNYSPDTIGAASELAELYLIIQRAVNDVPGVLASIVAKLRG